MNRFVALVFLLLVPLAQADDGTATAHNLMRGLITPQQAAREWEAAKLDPEELLERLRKKPTAPAKDAQRALELPLRDRFGRETDLQVTLPEGAPPEEGWPVVLSLHGLEGDGKAGTLTGLGLLENAITAAPSAKEVPKDELPLDLRQARSVGMDVGKRFKHWWSYRAQRFALLALAELRLRFPVDSNRVLLAGYSMGGYGTWNIGLRFHDQFFGLAPLAGGISRAEEYVGRDELCRLILNNARHVPCYFVHGDADDTVPVEYDRWTHDDLEGLRIKHVYVEVPAGPHVLGGLLVPDIGQPGSLRAPLVRWAAKLKPREPHPRQVQHLALHADHGGSYWLRVDELEGARASVRAGAKKSAVLIETRGVKRLTVFLDPELLKVKRTVTVAVDGKKLFRGKVKPSLRALAESLGRSRDPELAYTRAVTLEVPPREVQKEKTGLW